MFNFLYSLCLDELRIHQLILLLVINSCCAQFPSLDFGCKTYGCNPRADFTSPIPFSAAPPVIKWNWTDGSLIDDLQFYESTGCSCSMNSVACATASGYIRLKPSTGEKLWESSNMVRPYLPFSDIYGNIFGSDSSGYQEVYTGPRPQPMLNLAKFHPKYGLVMTDYDQTVLITSSKVETPQVITFGAFTGADESELGTLTLSATKKNVTGYYVPCGHPVINKDRAYIMTTFKTFNGIPNDWIQDLRLYAIDLPGYSRNESSIAWYFDDFLPYSDCFGTTVTFFNQTVYVNTAAPPPSNERSPHPPNIRSVLYGIRDDADSPSKTIVALTFGGPMAVFSTTESWWTSWKNVTLTGPRLIWVASQFPATLLGHDPDTGSLLIQVPLENITKSAGNVITSSLMVTRQVERPDRDVLVFGIQDKDSQAYVMAVEMSPPPITARLLWSINVSGPPRAAGQVSSWTVGGQIASFTVVSSDQKNMTFGLAVSVVERMLTKSQIYIKAIF